MGVNPNINFLNSTTSKVLVGRVKTIAPIIATKSTNPATRK
jgi:hypothetical protein